MPYDSIETALEAIRSGAFVVVMDDASRENTGFLVIGAEKITTKTMAFLLRHTRDHLHCFDRRTLRRSAAPEDERNPR